MGIEACIQKNQAAENFLHFPRKKPKGTFRTNAIAETRIYGKAMRESVIKLKFELLEMGNSTQAKLLTQPIDINQYLEVWHEKK